MRALLVCGVVVYMSGLALASAIDIPWLSHQFDWCAYGKMRRVDYLFPSKPIGCWLGSAP